MSLLIPFKTSPLKIELVNTGMFFYTYNVGRFVVEKPWNKEIKCKASDSSYILGDAGSEYAAIPTSWGLKFSWRETSLLPSRCF